MYLAAKPVAKNVNERYLWPSSRWACVCIVGAMFKANGSQLKAKVFLSFRNELTIDEEQPLWWVKSMYNYAVPLLSGCVMAFYFGPTGQHDNPVVNRK